MDWSVVMVALAAAVVGYLLGWRRLRRLRRSPVPHRRLEEYPFYPFVVDANGHVRFDADLFSQAVEHFLRERNERAAGELVVIGEQNLVRDTLNSDRLREYKKFYASYDGDAVVNDNSAFLENYRRIVDHLGRSFPNTGIEVLLHNLVNPSRSLVAIENAEVTGRSVGSGATNLVLDLKTRRQRGEDKINYELTIGARQFKCTTIPIFRTDYGLVGAICVNMDVRFLREFVLRDQGRLDAFIDDLLRTEFQLEENILSPDEYQRALRGKRHYMDDAIRSSSRRQGHRLAAILFSDIVDFTRLMAESETQTLNIVAANEQIHLRALAENGGRLLKRLGDGVLASFDSASEAVAAALAIRRAVAADGRFQVRCGIHLGEIADDGVEVYGDGVNLAARIQGRVAPGEIGVSDVVYANVRNKEGLIGRSLGDVVLKGVTEPVHLYAIEQ